jgi:hypothetical protein
MRASLSLGQLSNFGRRGSISRGSCPEVCGGGNLLTLLSYQSSRQAGFLCHGLCRNHRVPASVECCRALLLGNSRGAARMRPIRMNTVPRCQLRFGRVARLQSKMRNGMEEVVGSNPTRSTKSPHNLDGANACSGGICVMTRRLRAQRKGPPPTKSAIR